MREGERESVCVCVCDGKRLSPPQEYNTGHTWFLSFNSML